MSVVSTRSSTRKRQLTPSPRLNQIYHQDIVTLLPRECIESRMRMVSRRYNGFVVSANGAGKLPLQRYQSLEFNGVSLLTVERVEY